MALVTPDELGALDQGHTEEDLAMRDTVRSFVEAEVRPHLTTWFTEGHLPARELARRLGDLGVLGMHLDGYGCAGASASAYGLVCTEIEAADSGVRSLVSVQGSLAMHALHAYGSEEQRQQWLPPMARGERVGCFGLTEAAHGSDPAHMTTRARRDGQDWVLDGSKMWITNGSVADVAIVWAQTEEGIAGFVVPTDAPGFSATDVPRKLSLRASVTSEIVLDGVRLPGDAVLPGASGLRAPLGCLTQARLGIVFGSMGAARDALTQAIDYARVREQFGSPIAAFQLTQAKLADSTADYVTGMLLAFHWGRLADAGTLTPQQVSLGKLTNVRRALDIARQCRTILGGNGITADYSPMRHAMNLETVLTYEGTSEMHTLVVGQALTGHQAFR